MVTANRWTMALVNESCKISDIIRNLDASKLQICLVVTEERKLLGTITDGDVRRGLLQGFTLDSPAKNILKKDAMVVTQHMDHELVLRIMRANKILQMPVIDENDIVVGLHIWDQVEEPVSQKDNALVIMAGGQGTRLRPFTENCPKPMLHVKGKPMLEHIVLKAKREGLRQIIISTHYLGHMIEDYFQSGDKWGVNIRYLREASPLGTAGALSLISEDINSPFIVTNGDVLTTLNYSSLLEFHTERSATATMAVRRHEYHNPFGVVEIDGLNIVGFVEKPVITSHVNAGVYVLNPEVLKHISKDSYCDMPTLFEKLRVQKKAVMAYPIHEEWMDIGRVHDLEKANNPSKY